MANHRTPLAKAELTGSALRNPARFKSRKAPKNVTPLGEPFDWLTPMQLEAWTDLTSAIPWLNGSHRPILELACRLLGRLRSGEGDEVKLIAALSSILSKLGATPADESKIVHGDADEEDPTEAFFGRQN